MKSPGDEAGAFLNNMLLRFQGGTQ